MNGVKIMQNNKHTVKAQIHAYKLRALLIRCNGLKSPNPSLVQTQKAVQKIRNFIK
jgi:hypothetical protein